jgi:hypothetical protein
LHDAIVASSISLLIIVVSLPCTLYCRLDYSSPFFKMPTVQRKLLPVFGFNLKI